MTAQWQGGAGTGQRRGPEPGLAAQAAGGPVSASRGTRGRLPGQLAGRKGTGYPLRPVRIPLPDPTIRRSINAECVFRSGWHILCCHRPAWPGDPV